MNNLPPDLSPEARRLINAARGADDPTPDDQARVKARWLAGVAAVAGVSSLTEAARAAGGVGWGLKAVGAAVAIVAGAVGLYVALPDDNASSSTPAWAGRTHERHEKATGTPGGASSSSVEEQPRESATPSDALLPRNTMVTPGAPEVLAPVPANPPVMAPPASAQRVANEPAASPVPSISADRPAADVSARTARERAVASRAPARSGGRAVPAPVPVVAPPPAAAEVAATAGEAANASGQLGEELGLLSRVRSSVQDGSPERALELLADYKARFERPVLGMEADALRVDALCRAGQRDAARASAAAFQNEWPGSPLGRRVSEACP